MQARTLFEYYWETDEAFAILKRVDISICSRRSEWPFTNAYQHYKERANHIPQMEQQLVRKGDTLPITVLLHL